MCNDYPHRGVGHKRARKRLGAVNYCTKDSLNLQATVRDCVANNRNALNQVVFSSINYGTDTSAEGRLIVREMLKSTYQGVGNGETAIFPLIMDRGVLGEN